MSPITIIIKMYIERNNYDARSSVLEIGVDAIDSSVVFGFLLRRDKI